MNEVIQIAFVMVVNSFCYQLASVIFTTIKHKLNCTLGNDVMANRITLLDIQDAFENGAEYGYNKAMEENKKSALNGLVDAMNTWR